MNYEIILATNNKHKLKEVREILSPHNIIVYGLSDLNIKIPEVEENGTTYLENALIKAKAVQAFTTMPIISDDSGLEIMALNKEPGLHSARYGIQAIPTLMLFKNGQRIETRMGYQNKNQLVAFINQ